jgi:hypothetical protein
VFRAHGVKKDRHGTSENLDTNQTAAYHVQRISDETEVRKYALCYLQKNLRARVYIPVKKKRNK